MFLLQHLQSAWAGAGRVQVYSCSTVSTLPRANHAPSWVEPPSLWLCGIRPRCPSPLAAAEAQFHQQAVEDQERYKLESMNIVLFSAPHSGIISIPKRGDACQGGQVTSHGPRTTKLQSWDLNFVFFACKYAFLGCLFQCVPDGNLWFHSTSLQSEESRGEYRTE